MVGEVSAPQAREQGWVGSKQREHTALARLTGTRCQTLGTGSFRKLQQGQGFGQGPEETSRIHLGCKRGQLLCLPDREALPFANGTLPAGNLRAVHRGLHPGTGVS